MVKNQKRKTDWRFHSTLLRINETHPLHHLEDGLSAARTHQPILSTQQWMWNKNKLDSFLVYRMIKLFEDELYP